jgi:nucleotide-binding universal stress UspA family protein
MAPPFASHHGETLERTVDVARRLSDGRFRSAPGFNVPGFRYIDRELDVMRTSAGQMLDDGSPAKRALVLDLLLASADDGRPIVTEVKIRTDGHAISALIQALAAAAHLVTRPSGRALGRSTARQDWPFHRDRRTPTSPCS